MGIYDRDYYRRPARRSFGALDMFSVTTWLIIINVAIFVIDSMLFHNGHGLVYREVVVRSGVPVQVLYYKPLEGLGRFSIVEAIGRMEIWRFITFQFLHAGWMHLLFNMIALFFFGPLVESYLGPVRYLVFYLLCGVGGPIGYLILFVLKELIVSPATPLVGASAGIFGVIIAVAHIAPNETVFLYGILPMRLKTLAWLLFGVAAFTVLRYGTTGQENAGGEAAHLGGAAVGFLLIRNPQLLRWPPWGSITQRRPPF